MSHPTSSTNPSSAPTLATNSTVPPSVDHNARPQSPPTSAFITQSQAEYEHAHAAVYGCSLSDDDDGDASSGQADLTTLRRRMHNVNVSPDAPLPNHSPSPTNGIVTAHNQPTFDEKNGSYLPPTGDHLNPTPPIVEKVIRNMLHHVWGIDLPREYQIYAIFFLVFLKLGMMYLIRKTGEGKSLVLLGMATALRGITITMVPLLGLGSDQVSKSKRLQRRVESYHVDEFRYEHYEKLMERLKTYSPGDKSSIIIFISPQQLKSSSRWYKLFVDLAKKGSISAFCVDEAHATVENYNSFRLEFKDGVASINRLIEINKINNPSNIIPTLVMSATFRIPEQKSFNKLIGRFPDIVMWGPMDKRNVGIFNHVSGDPVHAILKQWKEHVEDDPDMQSLLYFNSAMACEDSIIPRLEKERSKFTTPMLNEELNCMNF